MRLLQPWLSSGNGRRFNSCSFSDRQFCRGMGGFGSRKFEAAGKAEKAGLRQQSYDDYGYAVECAIKALIMRKRRLNRWPDRDTQPQFYTHSLNALMKETTCFQEFAKERKSNHQLRISWLVIKDWQPSRYRLEEPSGRVIRDMKRAAIGVMEWLNRR